MTARLKFRSSAGFTLLELVVVLVIIGVASALIGLRSGSFSYWKDEGQLRRIRETIEFLYYQAVIDQEFYVLRIDLDNQSYRVGVLRTEEAAENEQVSSRAQGGGILDLELAAVLSPAYGLEDSMIPPPSLPSLYESVELNSGSSFDLVRTMRETKQKSEGGTASIFFSPRGFSEFAVIQLSLSSGKPVTILVNPFTGLTEQFPDHRDFEWKYGKKS